AVMLSAGQGLLFFAPFFGRLGQRHGIRRSIIIAGALAGTASIVAGRLQRGRRASAGRPGLVAGGAAGAAAAGARPFVRAVAYRGAGRARQHSLPARGPPLRALRDDLGVPYLHRGLAAPAGGGLYGGAHGGAAAGGLRRARPRAAGQRVVRALPAEEPVRPLT